MTIMMHQDIRNDEYLDKLIADALQYAANLRKIEDPKLSVPVLTSRENEILRLVIEGRTNREIASDLYIAEVTVRKNITSIYRKLDVNGRASAVKKAIELKII